MCVRVVSAEEEPSLCFEVGGECVREMICRSVLPAGATAMVRWYRMGRMASRGGAVVVSEWSLLPLALGGSGAGGVARALRLCPANENLHWCVPAPGLTAVWPKLTLHPLKGTTPVSTPSSPAPTRCRDLPFRFCDSNHSLPLGLRCAAKGHVYTTSHDFFLTHKQQDQYE